MRLYDFTPEQLSALQAIAAELLRGKDIPGKLVSKLQLEGVDGCTLSFRISRTDEGVIKDRDGLEFTWNLTPSGWQKAAHLIDAFRKDYGEGTYQWLDETSDISLLLSHSGRW